MYLAITIVAFDINNVFKDYRKGEFKKKFGDVNCFAGCDSADTLSHAMECKQYPEDMRFSFTNFNHDPNEQKEFIDYLEKLDKFRAQKWGLPVIYRPSLLKTIERKMKMGL